VLGRIVEALTAQATPYRSKVYSIYGIRKLVEGDVPPTVIGKGGVIRFSQYNDLAPSLHAMTDRASDSLFADTYAEILESSLVSTQRLGVQMGAVNLLGSYSGGTGMEQIARVMSLDHSVHESERDVFMVGVRTFDAHQNAAHMDINMLLGGVNADLEALHTDLVALDLWDSTTIVSIADVGRTLTSNGIGTDHAWGGNNFLLGGAVKGRRIHGQFPEDLNPATSELEVGRGRGIFVPTTPWEGMWYGVAEWFGVEADRLYDVVPNAANFPDSAVHTAEELYN
jgi:cullin-associated NEDD8-dissociated protein 1